MKNLLNKTWNYIVVGLCWIGLVVFIMPRILFKMYTDWAVNQD